MDALFLLPDLLEAEPRALTRWYEVSKQLEPALDLVTAIRGSGLLQHRFLNAAIAAESYHAARYDGRAMPKSTWKQIVSAATRAAPDEFAASVRERMAILNQPSLRDRIHDLVDRGGESLRSLLPDPKGLVERASRLRNELSHGKARDADSSQRSRPGTAGKALTA